MMWRVWSMKFHGATDIEVGRALRISSNEVRRLWHQARTVACLKQGLYM